MKTLVLDQGYVPLKVIAWHRALCMSLIEKVEVLASYDREVRTVSRSFQAPAVVRLLGTVRARPQLVRFSRRNVYLRDNHRCQYCYKVFSDAELTLDHVVPRVSGGKTSWTNVVAACGSCNRRKGGRTPEQAGLNLRTLPKRPQWSPLTVAQRLPEHDMPEIWRDWIFSNTG
jgi:5-methylcytosine-specific restriction endonuclease McrA